MEKSYLEKIQIHKENKLAGLHPGGKIMGGYSVYSLYVYFKFHTFDGSRIVIGGDSMVFSSADSMCCKWSNEKVREGI